MDLLRMLMHVYGDYGGKFYKKSRFIRRFACLEGKKRPRFYRSLPPGDAQDGTLKHV